MCLTSVHLVTILIRYRTILTIFFDDNITIFDQKYIHINAFKHNYVFIRFFMLFMIVEQITPEKGSRNRDSLTKKVTGSVIYQKKQKNLGFLNLILSNPKKCYNFRKSRYHGNQSKIFSWAENSYTSL